MLKQALGRFKRSFFTEKTNALRWDAIMQLGFVGFTLYLLVQLSPNAQGVGNAILTTVQTTLTDMLRQTF